MAGLLPNTQFPKNVIPHSQALTKRQHWPGALEVEASGRTAMTTICHCPHPSSSLVPGTQTR